MTTTQHPQLLSKIDAFLQKTGMGPSYFGKCAAGNSELVQRLQSGGRIWPHTEAKVLSYIEKHPSSASPESKEPIQ